jgi:pyridoxal phosphate enzyme (YggS family)
MSSAQQRIAENLANVRERIAVAARSSGRAAEAVRLVGVTKYVDHEVTQALVTAGCLDLGESRPQELWSKAPTITSPEPIRWHMVGHLQRNKIHRTLPLLHLLHSADSRRLLDALEAAAAELGRTVDVLLEANVSGDRTKTGFPPAELEPILVDAEAWPHVAIQGLMGMASLVGGLNAAKRDFVKLRELRNQLAANTPTDISLAELSMGMSSDFEAAIAEGATIVRVGSALFEGVPV